MVSETLFRLERFLLLIFINFLVQFLEVKVEVPVPKPYTVIKKVPYEVKEYVDKVRTFNFEKKILEKSSMKIFTAIQSVCGQTIPSRS